MSLYVETGYWEYGYAEGDIDPNEQAFFQPGGFYFEHRPKVKRKQAIEQAVEAAVEVVAQSAPEIRKASAAALKQVAKRLAGAVPANVRKQGRKAMSQADHAALIAALEREIAEILAAHFEVMKAGEAEDQFLEMAQAELDSVRIKRNRLAMAILLAS